MTRLLAASAAVLAFSFAGAAATVVPVGEFRSVELRNGGYVVIRHGDVPRVTMVKGDTRYTRVRVGSGQRLIIDDSGRSCPNGYEMEVEVVTPQLSAASVSNGGTLQAIGPFPAQDAIEAAVSQGGAVDIRAIPAGNVHASIYSGGGIFTTARSHLVGSVQSGGIITYWGGAKDVDQDVHDGGAVVRGKAADATRPLSEFGAGLPPIPPVPPVPPVQPIH